MLILWLFIMLASQVICFGKDISLLCPGNSCNCSYNSQSGVEAVCRVNDLRDLEKNIAIPDQIQSLDISLTMKTVQDGVFNNFTNLVHLSLAKNGISIIGPRAFEGLVKLKTLNLKENSVETWDLEPTNQLPSLQKVDVTANRNWTTPENILKLKSLQELQGLYLNDNCQNCRILKRNEMLKKAQELGLTFINSEGFTIQQGCLKKTFNINSSHSFLTTNSLFPACTLSDKHCEKSLGLTTEKNQCLQVGKTLLIAAFPTGIIVVLLNVVVVMEILSSKRLRRQPYLILVSFLAIADTLAGIYMIVMASVYQAIPLVEMETKRKDFCDYIGFLAVFANVMTMDISFLLTIERYLATIYWSKPNVRMHMKHVLLAPLLSIAVSFALSIWGLFNEDFTVEGFAGYVCYPIPDFKHQEYRVYSIIVVVAANLIYLTMFGLYLRIFFAARNSGRQVGVAREAKLAKRIGAVVFTNFSCNFLPFATFAVVIATGSFASSRAEVSVGTVVGCLIILPGINSIMNPILYAYSNNKLRRRLQKKIHCLTETVNTMMLERATNYPPVILLRVTNNTNGMTSGQQNRS